MAYFTKEFSKFLSDLEVNNNRDWFNANKNTFKLYVEEPFKIFIDDVISKIRKIDSKTKLTSKEAIFRIYRDVRFSKDKSPYKNYMSAVVTGAGRKDMTSPGMYLEMKADGITLYCGVYSPDPIQLQNIRYYIAKNIKIFEDHLADKNFVTRYKTMLGEKNKVIPADLKEIGSKQPLIYNKQFYFMCSLPKKSMLSEDIVDQVVACFKDGWKMNQFLQKAMTTSKK